MATRRNALHTQSIWLATLDLVCLAASIVIGVKIRQLLSGIGGMQELDQTAFGYIADYQVG